MDFHISNGLPIPEAGRGHALRRRAVDCASRLAAQDDRFADWASALKLKARHVPEGEVGDLTAELDATVAHLYGLAEADLVHIFETFHEGWDYGDRLDATIKHYRQLKSLA